VICVCKIKIHPFRAAKLYPVIVISVPPITGPEVGVTFSMIGPL
jgi:hypothetical protein